MVVVEVVEVWEERVRFQASFLRKRDGDCWVGVDVVDDDDEVVNCVFVCGERCLLS